MQALRLATQLGVAVEKRGGLSAGRTLTAGVDGIEPAPSPEFKEKEMGFRKGDVVRLKSGGPTMTVEELDGDYIGVVWFEQFGPKQVVKRESFPEEGLESADDRAASSHRILRG